MDIDEIVARLTHLKAESPHADKEAIERYLNATGAFTKQRSVYVGRSFAIRVSEANTGSFSNVVLSLSSLAKYDAVPMIICIVRPDRIDFRLANTSFLKKISHSSLALRLDNVRGSFLGHDIMDEYEGIPNRPDNFDQLSAAHAEFSWSENLERLVGTTNAIAARMTRFEPTGAEVEAILNAPQRTAAVLTSPRYHEAEAILVQNVERNRDALLAAAEIDNVNLRGNRIESIITGDVAAHRIDDIVFQLERGERLLVDIKTKLLDRASAPKAYNIDKMLQLLADPSLAFALFFIGLDRTRNIVISRMVSIFDPVVLNATRVQHHWAGRASRGVTQLTGDLGHIFAAEYRTSVAQQEAGGFLRSLIEK